MDRIQCAEIYNYVVLYRVAWRDKVNSGYGSWQTDKGLIQQWVKMANNDWPSIRHWLEEKDLPSQENVSEKLKKLLSKEPVSC